VNVPQARLSSQLLGKKKCKEPDEVVAWLGAVQAQDFAAARWALGLRMHKATATDIERAFNDGTILRTHVMRPTWHFVAPQDIRELLALTGPRVHAANAHMYRRLELDGDCLSRCRAVFRRALRGNNYLTRSELAKRLWENHIEAAGQRLAYILMHAELEALICSGPRRGKQFTYALLDERAPQAKKSDSDEALARWTLRYFASHGPAQLKDLAWWSGLALRDAQRGLDLAASHLAHEVVDDKRYWFSPNADVVQSRSPTALLLSIYDEYTIAYKDRSALGGERYIERLLAMGNALTSVLILEGKIAGTWKRIVKKGNIEIMMNPFRPLCRDEIEALRKAALRYGDFLRMPSVLSLETSES
jgi:Winged helix DNA-binding domain